MLCEVFPVAGDLVIRKAIDRATDMVVTSVCVFGCMKCMIEIKFETSSHTVYSVWKFC